MLKNRQIFRSCGKRHKRTATTDDSITKYAHNSQAQRVFKTAPLYAVTNPTPTATPTVLDAFTAFFESLWSPVTGTAAAAQKSGMSYVYDEDGTLIADTLTGGASTTWGQSARYIYLPTASGPMPIAAIYGTKHYAIQSDHLNTPRRLIQSDGQVAWQWAYSAFGEEKPTIAKTRFANADLNQSFGSTTVPAVTFNLRYPGQYFDQESGLHYNYHRSYHPGGGRYTQADPIGLDGGWNRFGYVGQNPLSFTDPKGLFAWLAIPGLCAGGGCEAILLALGLGAQQASSTAPPPNPTQCCTEFRNVYEPNSGKHGSSSRSGSRGSISPEPSNGASVLASSIRVKDGVRIGYDIVFDEIVVFNRHRTDDVQCIEYWHGYVVRLSDLRIDQWKTGKDAGFPNWSKKPK